MLLPAKAIILSCFANKGLENFRLAHAIMYRWKAGEAMKRHSGIVKGMSRKLHLACKWYKAVELGRNSCTHQ